MRGKDPQEVGPLDRIRHHGERLIVVMSIMLVAMIVITEISGTRSWILGIPRLLLTALLLSLTLMVQTHGRSPCLLCVDEWRTDDGALRAERERDALRRAHWFLSRSWLVVVMVAALLVSSSMSLMSWGWVSVTMLVELVWWTSMQRRHRQLWPWCPDCRGFERGDDEVPVGEPDPAGHGCR